MAEARLQATPATIVTGPVVTLLEVLVTPGFVTQVAPVPAQAVNVTQFPATPVTLL
jgi:hypothetical protein